MNYANIYDNDLVNGAGIRVSLFVSGCMHGKICVGCYNKEAQNFSYGSKYTNDTKEKILCMLSKPHITGLSLSGGDPLAPPNRWDIMDLCRSAKLHFPDKTIWLWTGYEWDEIKNIASLDDVDVVICGKFQQEKKLPSGSHYGSSNQYIIKPKELHV